MKGIHFGVGVKLDSDVFLRIQWSVCDSVRDTDMILWF